MFGDFDRNLKHQFWSFIFFFFKKEKYSNDACANDECVCVQAHTNKKKKMPTKKPKAKKKGGRHREGVGKDPAEAPDAAEASAEAEPPTPEPSAEDAVRRREELRARLRAKQRARRGSPDTPNGTAGMKAAQAKAQELIMGMDGLDAGVLQASLELVKNPARAKDMLSCKPTNASASDTPPVEQVSDGDDEEGLPPMWVGSGSVS